MIGRLFIHLSVIVVLLCVTTKFGYAKDYLSVDLAHNAIDITTGFDGDELKD